MGSYGTLQKDSDTKSYWTGHPKGLVSKKRKFKDLLVKKEVIHCVYSKMPEPQNQHFLLETVLFPVNEYVWICQVLNRKASIPCEWPRWKSFSKSLSSLTWPHAPDCPSINQFAKKMRLAVLSRICSFPSNGLICQPWHQHFPNMISRNPCKSKGWPHWGNF